MKYINYRGRVGDRAGGREDGREVPPEVRERR